MSDTSGVQPTPEQGATAAQPQLAIAAQYVKAGAKVGAVLDTSSLAQRMRALPQLLSIPSTLWKGIALMRVLKRARVPVHRGIVPVEIEGTPERGVSGVRVKQTVQTVDIMPTILDLLRIDPLEAAHAVQGRSLWPLMADADPAHPGEPAYSEAMAPLSSPLTLSSAPTSSMILLSSCSRSGGTLQIAVGGISPINMSRNWLFPFSAVRPNSTIAFGLIKRVP